MSNTENTADLPKTEEKTMASKAGDMFQSAKESVTGEKANQILGKAGGMFQSAKESVQGAGEQVKTKALDAHEAVKNATGMNK